jgi:hypothetical protein
MPTGPRISPNLLAEPPALPTMPRGADGTMSGAQCLSGGLDVYAVAGAIRLQLITLQAQLREEQAATSTR